MAARNRLDSIDRKILRILWADARLSVRALGREIGMSAGAVNERVTRLESSGIISGYRAQIDPAALGQALSLYLAVQLSQQRPVEDIVQKFLAVPEVAKVDLVSGRWDLIVHVRLRDQLALRDLLINKIWTIEDLRHSESIIVLEQFEAETPFYSMRVLDAAGEIADDGESPVVK